MIQHGELLLIPITELPDAQEVYSGNEYVVGHSETGHHHLAVGDVTVYKPMGADTSDLFLKVNDVSKIVHQKTFDRHKDIEIPVGLYIVRPKQEYDLFADLMRQVRD